MSRELQAMLEALVAHWQPQSAALRRLASLADRRGSGAAANVTRALVGADMAAGADEA